MQISLQKAASRKECPRGVGVSLAIALLLAAVSVQAQTEPGAAAESPPSIHDSYGRDTPRGVVSGFLEAVRKNDYERASRYLDLRGVPESGAEIARQLRTVLSRTLPLNPSDYSGDPEGTAEEGVGADRQRLGWIETPGGRVEILLARLREDNARVWKFAGVTVAQVPQLYDAYGYGTLERWLPDFFFDLRVLEVALWQWLALLAIIFFAGLLAWIATAVLIAVARSYASRGETPIDADVLSRASAPARLAIACLFFRVGVAPLGLGLEGEALVATAVRVLVLVAFTWFLLRLVDALASRVRQRIEDAGDSQATALVAPARRAIKIVLVVVSGVAILDGMGFSVTAIVASLGVGGIAVALAAQKTVENLFGGVTLYADRPIRVGDFCRFGDKVGTVEEIGIRSTRVRTLDRTVISIPNAEFSSAQIESYAVRDKMRLFAVLQIGYDTSPDQVRYLLVELREMLYAHPKTLTDPCRVRFVNFGAYSLDLEIFVFIDTMDWNEFLSIREDIFLRILDIVKTSGAYFAYPSQTLYLGQDQGRDMQRSREAEAAVEEWRNTNSLPLPNFQEARIQQLRDSLEYPPPGSATSES